MIEHIKRHPPQNDSLVNRFGFIVAYYALIVNDTPYETFTIGVIELPVQREIVKELRKDKGINQEEMGKRFGLSRSAYANYENGHRKMPIGMLEILADELETSTDYLLGRTEIREPYPPRRIKPISD